MPKSMYKGKGDAKMSNRGGSKVMMKGGSVKGGASHANRGGSKVRAKGGYVKKAAGGGLMSYFTGGNKPKVASDNTIGRVQQRKQRKLRGIEQEMRKTRAAQSKKYASGGSVKGDRSHANDYNVRTMACGGVAHTTHTKSKRSMS